MPLDPERLLNWPLPAVRHSYTERDTILYALGIGASIDPDLPHDLKYFYEQGGLVALPTMAVILGQGPFWMADPALGLDWKKIMHGEQRLKLHRQVPPAGEVVAQEKVEALYDKGSERGAIAVLKRELHDAASGDLVAETRATTFLRGDGGFGGDASGAPVPHPVPDGRASDIVIDLPTRADQAILYRLSGDLNPLHIDPEIAAAAGFPQPILHGLCTYGLAGRAIIRTLCDNDPARLAELDVRFSSPTFPGETIRVEIWKEDGGGAFRASSVERQQLVLNNGRARLR